MSKPKTNPKKYKKKSELTTLGYRTPSTLIKSKFQKGGKFQKSAPSFNPTRFKTQHKG